MDSPAEEPCVQPRDGLVPQVWSTELGAGPFSLLIGSDFDSQCPAPTYLPIEFLNRFRPCDKDALLQGYEFNSDGGLNCVDRAVLDKQRGIITEVIRQVATCLMKGQGIVGMSLPIRLFEPRSTLERLLDRWSFAPLFLRGARSLDPLERFKRIIAMVVAGLYPGTSQEKPFNPLLGETLEAYWPDGTQAYCEHTSHHPPVTNFLVLSDFYKLYGHYELTGRFKGNSLLGGFIGPATLKFNDGQTVTYSYASFRAGGIVLGTRTLNWEGEMVFTDAANDFEARLKFGPEKKGSLFSRTIGKTDDFQGTVTVGGRAIHVIKGSWLRGLQIDDMEYWNINVHFPIFHQFVLRPLPSDWRYREDLVWLSKGNSEYSQRWKIKIENKQREDRKLRQLRSQRH